MKPAEALQKFEAAMVRARLSKKTREQYRHWAARLAKFRAPNGNSQT